MTGTLAKVNPLSPKVGGGMERLNKGTTLYPPYLLLGWRCWDKTRVERSCARPVNCFIESLKLDAGGASLALGSVDGIAFFAVRASLARSGNFRFDQSSSNEENDQADYQKIYDRANE